MKETRESKKSNPLKGIVVLDLTRVLAGPTCTQILGDLGAEIIKVERPTKGDDSRRLGPPYIKNRSNNDQESAYYLSVNRNKKSITVDITKAEGQKLLHKLISKSDILIENFRAGTLTNYNLSYGQLKKKFKKLIYCSVTGFGQTGPYSSRGGYDFLVQGMGGIMSVTGKATGSPTKIGVGISDIMAGMYATISILAALRHREKTKVGQYIDIALLDSQVAWLSYIGQNYLVSGKIPKRIGNDHPSIVPYRVFEAKNGPVILAVGNDEQFKRFCTFAKLSELHTDRRFKTNSLRVKNRKKLVEILKKVIKKYSINYWVNGLKKANVPCSPINNVREVFSDPQVKFRKMKIKMPYPYSKTGSINLIGSPIKMSDSKISYKLAPPKLGQDTEKILKKFTNLNKKQTEKLRKQKII